MIAILSDPLIAVIVHERVPISDIVKPVVLCTTDTIGSLDPIEDDRNDPESAKSGIIRCCHPDSEKVWPVLDATILY